MSGRRRGAMSQAVRVLRLRDLLSGRRTATPIADLAARVGVSERQLRRDLDAIEAAGWPVEKLLIDGRRAVRLAGGPRSVTLTRRERFSLLAARQAFDVLRGTPFADDLDSVCAKLSAAATAAERAELAALARAFVFVPDAGVKVPPDPDVLDALQTGALDRRLVEHEYRDARGRLSRGVIAAYALVGYRNGLYVLGRREPDDGIVRTWAVERFASASVRRGSAFTVPAGLDVATHFATGFGVFASGAGALEVVVDFSADVARLIAARTWHPSQRIEPRRGGRVRVRFAVSALTEVVPWVMSWGWHAVPVAPPELVERVRQEHRSALAGMPRVRRRR